jgi:hypothetical protein
MRHRETLHDVRAGAGLRAGALAAKRSRTSTFVPGGSPQGASLCFLP